jgi:antitoxin HigA-1
MIPGRILLTGFIALTAQSATPPTQAGTQQSPCARAVADAATGEICSGDQAARLATAAPMESTEKTRQWELAAEHYRRAVLLTSNVATKVVALSLLADAYDTLRLQGPGSGGDGATGDNRPDTQRPDACLSPGPTNVEIVDYH